MGNFACRICTECLRLTDGADGGGVTLSGRRWRNASTTLWPLSDWSRMVADLLVGAGFEYPALEHRVRRADGNFVAQVDLAFPSHRVAIELDSARWHDNRESFVQDRRRRNEITLAGWTVLNFTWSDYADHPAALCEAVAKALCNGRGELLSIIHRRGGNSQVVRKSGRAARRQARRSQRRRCQPVSHRHRTGGGERRGRPVGAPQRRRRVGGLGSIACTVRLLAADPEIKPRHRGAWRDGAVWIGRTRAVAEFEGPSHGAGSGADGRSGPVRPGGSTCIRCCMRLSPTPSS